MNPAKLSAFFLLALLVGMAHSVCPIQNSLGVKDFHLTDGVSSYSPGDVANISVLIENKGEYALFNSILRVQVINKETNTMVDDFFAPISSPFILPNDGEEVQFQWMVPQNTPGGPYNILLYIYSDTFPISGDAHTGRYAGFTSIQIDGIQNSIELGRNDLLVNGEPLAIPYAPGSELDISFSIRNNGQESNFTASYSLFVGNSLKHKEISSLISRGLVDDNSLLSLSYAQAEDSAYSEKITVEENENKTLSHSFALPEGIYALIIGVTSDDGRKALLPIKLYIGEGLPVPSIVGTGISKFPVFKGESATLLTCMMGDGTITSKLMADDKIVFEGSSDGDLTDSFTAKEKFDNGVLISTLYKDESLVDISEVNLSMGGYEKEITFSLDAFQSEDNIVSSVSLFDEFGEPATGEVVLFLFFKGRQMASMKLYVDGTASSIFPISESGEYEVRAVEERTNKLATAHVNATNVTVPLLPPTPPAPPIEERGILEIYQHLILPGLTLVVLLVIVYSVIQWSRVKKR